VKQQHLNPSHESAWLRGDAMHTLDLGAQYEVNVIASTLHTCTCVMRSKLMDMAGSLSDESQLVTALAQNDTLTAAMARYDELLAKASAEPTVLPPSGR
jgi:hypothetical protein